MHEKKKQPTVAHDAQQLILSVEYVIWHLAHRCSRRNRDPRGTNCVMMDRLGGCAHAPMNITCTVLRRV